MDKQNQNLKTGPKDVFIHLLNFGVLYVSVISFIALLFQYINVLFPDKLNFYYQGILDAIRWSSSSLIILFPVFLLTAYLLMREFKKDPARKNIKFRKWLIYFTLFVASITVIVDLVRLIYIFYSGELTVRFLLKVIIVLITVVTVFWYYLWDLKIETESYGKKPKIIAWMTSVIVLATLIISFFVIGSPAEQRKVRFDEQRVQDLQMLQSEILYNYWTPKGKLPENLAELNNPLTGFSVPKDPKTLELYKYQKVGDLTFELCADFEAVSTDNRAGLIAPREAYGPYPVDTYQQNWNHGLGKVCFSRTIDPELYKPSKKNE